MYEKPFFLQIQNLKCKFLQMATLVSELDLLMVKMDKWTKLKFFWKLEFQ
jgi:hypothetical protein